MVWIKEIDTLVNLCSYLSFYKAQGLTLHCQEARFGKLPLLVFQQNMLHVPAFSWLKYFAVSYQCCSNSNV